MLASVCEVIKISLVNNHHHHADSFTRLFQTSFTRNLKKKNRQITQGETVLCPAK